jgi:hypothetical protein
MKRSPSIRLKAAFLLLLFSLNTVVGFACAVGFDMDFNSSHHQEEKTVIAHKDVSAHQHSELHSHNDQNDPAAKDHHSSKKSKDNCCTDEVAKFAKVDKLTPQSSDLGINSVFFTAFLSTFYHFDVFVSASHTPNNKFFVRTHHPPIPDIRVAIQSFQI